MRIPRVLVQEPIDGRESLVLARDTAHHVQRVLRLRAGHAVVLFDGHGGEYHATLVQRDGRLGADLEQFQDDDRDTGALAITLWQAVCRGGRMDTVVEKATELGVRRIVPLLTQRAVVRLEGDRGEQRRQHWQRVVHAACEQSGLNRIPKVAAPQRLEQALADLPTDAQRWWLDPSATHHLGSAALRSSGCPLADVIVLVGPEGGFDPREERLLDDGDFERLHLGPRVLRSDTAGLAALAMLHGIWAISPHATVHAARAHTE